MIQFEFYRIYGFTPMIRHLILIITLQTLMSLDIARIRLNHGVTQLLNPVEIKLI